MKNVFLFSLVLALLASCQPKTTDICKLSGTITNADSLVVRLIHDRVADTLQLAEDGTFSFDLKSEKPVNATLLIDRNRASLYLAPGKTLIISVDAADFDNTLGFDGELRTTADYLLQKSKMQSEWFKGYRDRYLLEPQAFRAARDSFLQVQRDLLNGYVEGEGIDQGFAEREDLALQFRYISDLTYYPGGHKYYAKLDTVILPDDWESFKDGLDLNNALLMEVPAAQSFLNNYISEEAQKAAGLKGDVWGSPEFLIAKIDFIKKTFTNPVMQEKLIYSNVDQQLDANGPAGAEPAIEDYLSTASDTAQKAALQKKVDDWAVIANGQPAPAFTVVDIEGNEHTLAEFKGKYVYIDFWATWCGPCITEMPPLVKLYEDYKDRNIAIMSISVDKNKPAWEKMVKEKGFAWFQFHDETNMNDLFLVRYIPTYVFIGPDGKIINNRAPRPSEAAVREMFDDQKGL